MRTLSEKQRRHWAIDGYIQLERVMLGHEFKPGSYFYVPQDQVEVIHNGAAGH